ncbi:MAG: bifunctional aspartate kinase/homoserine dehydrogenase I [Spirochaetaceae bacterium]|jgi:aspartokinase/homoserine dehydrogenase 1|nr:bifunctional aspartate kinase/homoserine dehydrogenase I [Spirochaetaceae bacterium]
MRVLKFGGTSLGSAQAIRKVVEIIKDNEHTGKVQVVVASAMAGATDALIDLAQRAQAGDHAYIALAQTIQNQHQAVAAAFLPDSALAPAMVSITQAFEELIRTLDGVAILRELSPRILDEVMSFGERLSASLLAQVLRAVDVPAAYLDTRTLILTDNRHGNAQVLAEQTARRIRAFFKDPKTLPLQIATGFIAATEEGATTTLGRGGSDLSAALFGAVLEAESVEIWTDVDGILTADPRMVKNAFTIDALSYVEAMELSHFGAQVLYPPTIRPALEKGIPLRVRNTFNPEGKGTWIVKDIDSGPYPIRGISSMNHVVLIRVQGSGMVGVAGFSSRLFGALARRGINIILITQSSSEYSICFAVLPDDAQGAEVAVREEFQGEIDRGVLDEPVIESDLAIIAVVGCRMKLTSGISGRIFHALGRNGVNVVAIAQGSSELNISAVIARQDQAKALNAIHEVFFLAGARSVNLFLLGIGLIGGTLLDQLADQQEVLAGEHQIRINLVGAANSRYMRFNPEGLEPKEIKSLSGKDPKVEPFTLEGFIERMQQLNLPNSAFCDCTASDDVAAQYEQILRAAIPVVTPNKRANSGPYDYYKRLITLSKDRGIPYLYEVTVCAGLPVISTLRDLFLSGDKVRRIEAVLSGTLSFIFNNYDGSRPFSALVRDAKAKGYTEPDPRDDLNAKDAARKALILARECGMVLEFSDVMIEPILPAACFAAAGVEAFFTELEKSDEAFEQRRAAAAARGEALRYVAVIEGGSARLTLRSEPAGSPFRSLVDSDNIVVITTDRYSALSIVIKGPGAGAQVTAGGVFADILRIARTLV